MTEPKIYELKVDKSTAGQRLDLFVTLKIPAYSRSYLKQLINTNRVTVNGQIEFHPQYRIHEGETIIVTDDDAVLKKQNIRAVKMDLDIVYEDDHILALNKPTGVVVHPGSGHWDDTLANAVKYYLQQKQEYQWDEGRVGQIHRIDGPTSGLILFAKSPTALWQLSKEFAAHTVEKVYLAIVKGNTAAKFRVSNQIGRHKDDPNKFSANTNDGKQAITDFRKIMTSKNRRYSLVVAIPLTGRTHQIRVHLAEKHYPIIGDAKYHGERYGRLMLHAYSIKFKYELNGKDELQLIAKPTDDFMFGLKELDFEVKDFQQAINQALAKLP